MQYTEQKQLCNLPSANIQTVVKHLDTMFFHHTQYFYLIMTYTFDVNTYSVGMLMILKVSINK